MMITFYVAAAIAILSTALMITRLNAVHALLYLVVSLLAVAIVFYVLGAHFVAALEVIIYAGAIMVLFVFLMMMLNVGDRATRLERSWLSPGAWIGPAVLAALLLVELIFVVVGTSPAAGARAVDPKQVALSLYGPYLLGVELVSMLLLAGIVGAYHLGRTTPGEGESANAFESDGERTLAGGDLVHSGARRPAGAPQRDLYTDVH